MKKRLLTLALGIAACFTLSAQVLVNSEGETIQSTQEANTTGSGYSYALDYYGSWNKDTEILGLGLGFNLGKNGYMDMGLNLGLGDIDWYSYRAGIGLQHRFVSEQFLFQVKAFPYIGFNDFKEAKYNSKTGKVTEDDKFEFTYGAQARLEAGIKLFETKKKNDFFLVVGYGIAAPEFETENMFDNGDWYVGITLVH